MHVHKQLRDSALLLTPLAPHLLALAIAGLLLARTYALCDVIFLEALLAGGAARLHPDCTCRCSSSCQLPVECLSPGEALAPPIASAILKERKEILGLFQCIL
jgi:hypothetical protein